MRKVFSRRWKHFDAATNAFTAAGALLRSEEGHAAAVLSDGRVLLAGGSDETAPLASTDILNPTSNATLRGSNLLSFRTGLSATTLLNGDVLIAGGHDGSTNLATSEISRPESRHPLRQPPIWRARGGIASPSCSPTTTPLLTIVQQRFEGVPLSLYGGVVHAVGRHLRRYRVDLIVARAGAAATALGVDGLLLAAGGSGQAKRRGLPLRNNQDQIRPTTHRVKSWDAGVPLAATRDRDAAAARRADHTRRPDAYGDGGRKRKHFRSSSAESHDLGVRFYLTASGAGSQAHTTFTDADVRNYSASIAPTADLAGHTAASYTVTIRNKTDSTKELGSANVTIPTGYSSVAIASVTPPAGKTWSATIASGVIQLRAANNNTARLSPGESVVAFTANAPCTSGSYSRRPLGELEFWRPGIHAGGNAAVSHDRRKLEDPTISINDVSVVEGNTGTTNATFTVTLSSPSGRTGHRQFRDG